LPILTRVFYFRHWRHWHSLTYHEPLTLIMFVVSGGSVVSSCSALLA